MRNSFDIQIIGYSDAAGRIRPSDPMAGNQDNFFISVPQSKPSIDLNKGDRMPDYGVVMAVADGTGGLKHGEVASQVAIDTLAEYFNPSNLIGIDIESQSDRRAILNDLIRQADVRIKQKTQYDVNGKVMGSTLVIAWLYRDELIVSWIGDSRAYIYNKHSGITRLTRDHSKVQEMVDSGEISEAEAFSHPKRNIVTRILGDPTREACPDTITCKVKADDVILLCSDGLSGVLRDRCTSNNPESASQDDDIESILRNGDTVQECTHRLWASARRNHWHDNVTTILCRIVERCDTPDDDTLQRREKAEPGAANKSLLASLINRKPLADASRTDRDVKPKADTERWHPSKRILWLILPAILIILTIILITVTISHISESSETNRQEPTEIDTSTPLNGILDNVPLADDAPTADDSDN